MAQPVPVHLNMRLTHPHRFCAARYPRRSHPKQNQYLRSRGLLRDPNDFTTQNAGMIEPRMGCIPKSTCKLCNVIHTQSALKVRALLRAHTPELCQHTSPSVLELAVEGGNFSIFEILLNAGATYDKQGLGKRKTLLQHAVLDGNDKIATLLVNDGANIYVKDTAGCTLLHRAAQSGNQSLVEMFIKLGLSVSAKDVSGRIPLLYAVVGAHIEAVGLLLKAESDVNEADQYGNTVLHMAVCGANKELVRRLLRFGADFYKENALEHTALEEACFEGNYEAIISLMEAGAKDRLLELWRDAGIDVGGSIL